SAACGGCDWKYFLAARYDWLKPRTKASSLPRCKPTAGSVTISMPDAAFTACWSTSLGEISNVTAQSRWTNCSATASPGNRCPPVPPHAMATEVDGSFIKTLTTVNSVKSVEPLNRQNRS